ncbi:MAG: hypothetical protein ABI162_18500 [Luteolibacter sp.]
MTRLLLILFSGILSTLLHANPEEKQKLIPEEKQKSIQQTQEDLQKFLIGTTWIAEGESNNPHSFLKNGTFAGKKLKPTYTVTGRRTVNIFWGAKTKIPCLITEDCSTMIELAGERHTFSRK